MNESVILKGICDYLSTRNDVYWFRSAAGAIQTQNGRYFKTGRPGCPDITVCHRDKLFPGSYIGIEVKTATGKQSKIQKQAQADIEAAGGRYYICRSVSDVKAIFT